MRCYSIPLLKEDSITGLDVLDKRCVCVCIILSFASGSNMSGLSSNYPEMVAVWCHKFPFATYLDLRCGFLGLSVSNFCIFQNHTNCKSVLEEGSRKPIFLYCCQEWLHCIHDAFMMHP